MERLDDLLASLFYEPDTARLLLTRIGFPPSRIPAFNTATVFWSRVVQDLENGLLADGSAKLIEEARRQFPGNTRLQALDSGRGRPVAVQPAAAPSRPPPGQSLSAEWIARVYRAGIDANLPSQRGALLGRLPKEVRASLLPDGSSTAATILMTDLSTLNDIAEQGDSGPLLRWLETAGLLSSPFQRASSTFADAASQLAHPRSA